VFIAILAVFLVFFGGSVALLLGTMKKRAAVEAELNAQRERRATLWGRRPFPSRPNVETIQRNAQEMKALVDDFLGAYRGPAVEAPALEGLEAKQRILVACRQMSEMLTKGEVKHPEKFQFGFERYATYPPKPEHTPLLLKQLAITSELVRLLAEARVHDFTAIRRVEFEDTFDPGKPSGGYDPKAEPLVGQNGKFEFVNQPNYLYSSMPFDLEFICDTDALRKFLTTLSASPFVFVPRIITVENEKKEPMSATGKAASGGDPTGGFFAPPPPTPTRGVKKGVEVVKPSLSVDPTKIRPVMGEERIRVGMRLDWLDFRHNDTPKAAAGADHRKEKGGAK
jgi:hypothetical protein